MGGARLLVGIFVVVCVFGFLLSGRALAVDACVWRYETGADAPGTRVLSAGVVWGNRFYLIGGRQFDSDIYNNLWSYDPIADSWEELAPLPENVGGMCAVAYEGKIYSVAGFTGLPFDEIDKLYIYDIESDSWSQGASLPAALYNTACALIDGKIYVAGGLGATAVDTLYIYDISSDTWSSGNDLPAPVGGARGAVWNGQFFVVGGWNSDTNYRYIPASDSWSTLEPVPGKAFLSPLMDLEDDSNWPYFYLFGIAPNWSGSDTNVYGYYTSGNYWYIPDLWVPVPAVHITPASANFHDAVFVISTGYIDGAAASDTTLFYICAPYVSEVDPSVVVNYRSTEVMATGLNFDDAGDERFSLIGSKGTTDLNYTVNSSTEVVLTIPEGLDEGAYDLYVRNSFNDGADPPHTFGLNERTFEDAITVEAPAPQVDSISPSSGEVGAGEVDVTIEGEHFFEPIDVKLEGPSKADIECRNPEIENYSQIACTLDLSNAAAGSYDLVVTTDNGEGTLDDAFEMTEPGDDDIGDDDDDDDDDDGGCGCTF